VKPVACLALTLDRARLRGEPAEILLLRLVDLREPAAHQLARVARRTREPENRRRRRRRRHQLLLLLLLLLLVRSFCLSDGKGGRGA
jgi:hypothetical protein